MKSSRHNLFARKMIHLIGGFSIIGAYSFIMMNWSPRVALIALILALVALFIIEFVRIELGMLPFLREVLRPHEEKKPSSSVPMLVGSIIAFAAFDYLIAVTAILMVVIGDTVATLARVRQKTSTKRGRITQADLAEFGVNLLLAFLILQDWNLALPMALVATVVETMSFRLDDNMTVPVAAGLVGQLISWLIL